MGIMVSARDYISVKRTCILIQLLFSWSCSHNRLFALFSVLTIYNWCSMWQMLKMYSAASVMTNGKSNANSFEGVYLEAKLQLDNEEHELEITILVPVLYEYPNGANQYQPNSLCLRLNSMWLLMIWNRYRYCL
ncbi:uncharacterized protein LOC110864916 [Helianthus annuus]|uniref:uncharacterized protein LOC110864916 n=1 Tax=Helianthus annuus TaxID=4232 RepID=UPI0016533050|nr:uncharacterized protein LOC110864916 [Helianthus annuus]